MNKTSTLEIVKPIRGEVLKPKDVAERLKVSLKTVYNLAALDEIPSHRVRTGVRFDSADVDDYLFFSKFNRRGTNLSMSKIEKQEILARFDDQVLHARAYVEKIINEAGKKGGAME